LFQVVGINHFFFFLNRRRKRVLTYHNVFPDTQFSGLLHELKGISHTESVFRAQLAYIKSKFLCGINLDDAGEVTFTFDDGYLNQYAVAHPILKKFQVRAYFFCTLDMLRGKEPLLIDELLFWLSYVEFGNYELRVHGNRDPILLEIWSENDRRQCWRQLYQQFIVHDPCFGQHLRDSFDRCRPYAELRKGLDASRYALRFSGIPAPALAEMKAYGHYIGAHSQSHLPLASLAADEAENEIRECAKEIGGIFNCAVFCYPFGGTREVSQREIELTARHGFTHALANTYFSMPNDRCYSPHFVPRIGLPFTANKIHLAYILSGAQCFLHHRRLFPKWKTT
jgi:peptidoglycan/xylan/chitin deacetylase (PgdA/CDA1 family)